MAAKTASDAETTAQSAWNPHRAQENFDGLDAELGESKFDDCFETMGKSPTFILSRRGSPVFTVEFLEGYRYAQIFAPKDKEFVAIEPMTAPTNALASGRGLSQIAPGGQFRDGISVSASKQNHSPTGGRYSYEHLRHTRRRTLGCKT